MNNRIINKLLKQNFSIQISIYVLILLLVYIIAIIPTSKLFKDIRTYKQHLNNSATIQETQKTLTEKYNRLYAIFNPNDTANLSHEKIHEFIGKISNKYKVNFTGFEGPVLDYKKTLIIENHIVTLEGDYKGLVKSLFEIEKKNIGVIASSSFFKNKDLKTREFKLYLKIYLQTIRKNENN